MANSLRAKISKLRYDGKITEDEYISLITKLDGHDRELVAKTVNEFTGKVKPLLDEKIKGWTNSDDLRRWCERAVDSVAEHMKSTAPTTQQKEQIISDEELEKLCSHVIDRMMVDNKYIIHVALQALGARCERLAKQWGVELPNNENKENDEEWLREYWKGLKN